MKEGRAVPPVVKTDKRVAYIDSGSDMLGKTKFSVNPTVTL